jgi:cation diffusion facilitator family transporter
MPSSDKPVYVAMAANLVVAVAKFVASAFTGSSSMLAEGVHSLVDTGSNGLLLLGSRARKREPDETHPFGYGKEQYFWALIVAVLLFALGGGVSSYEGISRLLEPEPIEHPIWNYGVLAVALLSDGFSWIVAFRQLRARRRETNILRAALASKDPSSFAIWFEDSAAIAGVVLAFLGVLFSQLLDSSYPDGIGSVLIGLTMAGTAILLSYETKKLLIGEGADPALIAGIREIVEADEGVAHCGPPLTMHLGPEDILLNLDVQFREDLTAEAIIETVDRLEHRIRSRYREIRRIFIEAERLRHRNGRPAEAARVMAGHVEDHAPSSRDERSVADY